MATPEEEFSRELSRLVERLDALETTVGGLQERLGALERRQGAPAAPAPLPPPPPAQVALRPAPPTLQRPVPPAPADPPIPEASAPPAAPPPATVTPSAAAQPPPAPRRGPELPENWLTEVALKWAAPRVAGVALILAAIFALQWAIQNHRISPAP